MQDGFISWGRRAVFAASIASVLAACGGGSSGSSDSASSTAPNPPAAGNTAPAITGTAPQSVAVGKPYNFQPSATDPNGDSLTFSITSKPGWASFDKSTGRMWGTPGQADVGTHEEIVVKVSDGKATTELPQFAVTVTPGQGGSTGSATLAWQPPSQNTDGSALVNLSGYKIHVGTIPGSYTKTIPINNVGVTSYVVEDLTPGTYYFAITAVSASGFESSHSGEASKTIS